MTAPEGPRPLSPTELRARLDAGEALVLLDVRQPGEVEICAIEGSVNVPLNELSVRISELDPDAETVCICHHGIRSAHAAGALFEAGFERLWNLSGGMDGWASEVDPSMQRY